MDDNQKSKEELIQLIQTLRINDARHSAMVSYISDVIGIIGADGLMKYKSPNIEKWFGWKPQELIGKNGFNNIHPDDQEMAMRVFMELMQKELSVRTIECNYKCEDGTYKPIELTATNLINDPNIGGILINYHDISDRKQAEKAIQESEKNYRHLFKNLIVGFALHEIILDEKGKPIDYRFLEINPAFEKMTGLKAVDLIGKTSMEVLPNTESYWIEAYGEVALTGKVINFENYSRELDKHYQVSSYSPEYGKFATIFLDITEHKIAEEKLRENEHRYLQLVDTANEGILVLQDGFLKFINPKILEITGRTEEYLLKVSFLDLIYAEDQELVQLNYIKRINGEEVDQRYQVRIKKNDESVCWIEMSGVIIDWDGKPATLNFVNDISERIQTEEKLLNYTSQIELKNLELDMALFSAEEATAKAQEMATQAEIANKSKSMFLANMSHEIRTPLNAIIGFSQLMNRDKQLSESLREYNTSIIRASEHLLDLINDILELSKVEAGRVVLNPTNTDLYSLLEDIKIIFKERAQSKNIQFIFKTSSKLPRFIVVDNSKLRQIFVNLIGNAIKFTEKGAVSIHSHVLKIDDETSKLVVEVQDTGPGIPEGEIKNLFKHFVQTSSGINKGSGTGLGLALSRELAILLGGNINVSSKVGKGSLFTFDVEIKEGIYEEAEEKNNKQVICVDSKDKIYKILVVDDKEENLKVAVNLLKMVGFETNEAVNGEDAFQKFEQWSPDLVLMDMRMPIMDGYEATRKIKLTKKGKNTPIIALTASTYEDEQKKVYSLGMQGYIRKPFRENEMFGIIGKVLGISYIYEEQVKPEFQDRYTNNEYLIESDLSKLPEQLLFQMQEAISVADLDLLIELIKSIEKTNMALAEQLMEHARNYNYEYLQLIFSKKA